MHPIAIGNAIAVAATLLAIAGVVVATIVSNQKNHQAKLDFLRNAMERGVALDSELIDKIMHPKKPVAGKQPLPRGQGACVAGIVTIAFGVGYAIMALLIAISSPSARLPMLGVACLMACIGIGLLVVSKILRNEGKITDPRE